MRILFFGYWGANDGLSQSTINPHLLILCSFPNIEKVVYVSIEREMNTTFSIPDHSKIVHIPYYSKFRAVRFLNKIGDFLLLPRFLIKLINIYQINFLLCRSSLSGAIGFMVYKRINIRYAVESFEPHAKYMLEAGIWNKASLSYLLQTRWEKKQMQTASLLMPVSNNFKIKLIESGVPGNRIFVAPCAVNIEIFRFNRKSRESIRSKFGIEEDSIVGIYVGKFGGIYLNDQAFKLFSDSFRYLKSFFLFVLTPQDAIEIGEEMSRFGLDTTRIAIISVSHQEVPAYLSASDFAYSLHSPTESKKYVSPIKNGEYWANGLPIVMPLGIGDDSDIIRQEKGAGVLIRDEDGELKLDFRSLTTTIDQCKSRHSGLAEKYRNFELIKASYAHLVNL